VVRSVREGRRTVAPEDYFTAAFALLAAEGPAALRMRTLCDRLDVTWGSFYHHFRDLAEFRTRLLDWWETTATGTVVADAARAAELSPARAINVLREGSLRAPHAAERALRSWAAVDAEVAASVARVDQHREDALAATIVRFVDGDEQRARALARFCMAVLIGFQQEHGAEDVADLAAGLDLAQRLISAGPATT
jgi:AcrR family transcriptional regulator